MQAMTSTFAAGRAVAPGAVAPRAAARCTTVNVVARGARWCPGTESPEYLNGSLPGDYGFDPLGLGKNPELLAKFRENEVINGRWAMLAFPGVVAVEALGYGNWIDANQWKPTYFGNDVGVASFGTSLAVQAALMAFAEGKRAETEDPEKRIYPGGAFDPMGMSKGNVEELRTKEIKNGRLAMVAMAGIFSQGAVTHEGVLAAISKHVADPWGYNVATSNSIAIPILHTDIVGNSAFWQSAVPAWIPGV